jgi:hypothetical protein
VNPSAAVTWAPALIALGIGLVSGALVIVRTLRSPTPARAGGQRGRDLAAKRDALVRQLQELEDTGSKRTAEQLLRERSEIELAAARVLLEIEEGGGEPAAPAARPERFVPAGGAPRAGFRTFGWGLATASAVWLLAVLVWRSAQPRDEGGVVTGGSAMSRAVAGDEEQLTAALARNPSDLSAHVALAHARFARHDLMGVWNEAARILELSPGNPTALAYQAAVRVAMGQPEIAVQLLRSAIAAEPAATAVAAAPAAAQPARRHVAGRIDLDPALAAAVRPGAVLFVYVRPAGVASGPPTAVKRLPPVFPAVFDLSDDDAMMGQPFPDPLLVEARLDEDGDPTTRPPTDPKAHLDGVRAGRTDLRLVLRRP